MPAKNHIPNRDSTHFIFNLKSAAPESNPMLPAVRPPSDNEVPDDFSERLADQASGFHIDNINDLVQQALFDHVHDLLPRLPEADRLINEMSNVDMFGLETAVVLSEVFSSRKSVKELFNIIAAPLLFAAENGPRILKNFNKDLQKIVWDIDRVSSLSTHKERAKHAHTICQEAKDIMMAEMLSDLIRLKTQMNNHHNFFVAKDDLHKNGTFIADVVNDNTIDSVLVKNAVRIFNEVCSMNLSTQRLVTDPQSGRLAFIDRNPPPPRPKR